jgi:glutamine amidotransferase
MIAGGVTVIDYGVGNLGSVVRAFRRVGVEVEVTAEAGRVMAAERLVLPGVGHFGRAMTELRGRGLETPLREAVGGGARLLGICVGFQMLFASSEEAPGVEGLGLLPGAARRFESGRAGLPVPHVGWNEVRQLRKPAGLFQGIAEREYFYFLHSYYVVAGGETALAHTDYGVRFCSVAGEGRLWGIQFHPEKSQKAGLRVLGNFSRQ